MSTRILIAGLAGASLGTEIAKCLSGLKKYQVFGCDISPLAYGLYSDDFDGTFVADSKNYIESVLDFCEKNGIKFIIPGGEQPNIILSKNYQKLGENAVKLVGNSNDIVEIFSDKSKSFRYLENIGVSIPKTIKYVDENDIAKFEYPCIVKPSTGSGGSDSVFLASNSQECLLYVSLLNNNDRDPLIQEYIDIDEGEYTVGVLSDLDSNIIGSIAMKRIFNSKLSVAYKGSKGLISSGYSQGLISNFEDIRNQAEAIAKSIKSKGPLNIQGRVKNGTLIPFEINPRFSASTYLRKMAGFNEIDMFLDYLIAGTNQVKWDLKEGYYLRSFEERYIPAKMIKQ